MNFCISPPLTATPWQCRKPIRINFRNATDLGGHTAEEWVDSLQRALSEIERWLPECWSELGWFMQRIVPVGYHPEKHLSASYTESIGLAYVSLHPDTVIMAEAIVHESQHSKLNMLMALRPGPPQRTLYMDGFSGAS